jgi:hypothetical protein
MVGQVDVGPAGEPVLPVPEALAVAEQDEFVHGDAIAAQDQRGIL